MVFSSIACLFFFLPITLAIHFFPWNRWRNGTLLLLSFVFYAWGETEQLLILPISILVNYLLGLGISLTDRLQEKSAQSALPETAKAYKFVPSFPRKLCLACGILFNVGLLVCYKYSGFLAENLNPLLVKLDLEAMAVSSVRAPLGISFFTFHALSYLVDIFRQKASSLKNPLDLALYFSFFPKVLAGPIVEYQDARQDLGGRWITQEGFLKGVERFVAGLGKKVLIANPLAAVADKIFGISADQLTFGVAWLGILCFTLQIFYDFAGYTDMAIGVGRMLGFRLPENFNYPYASQSVRDFWRRWHISLSRWLRDYLYIPLGGNRCGLPRQYVNLITVFLVCGLWHGASWNFVVWGMWYGLFLVLERTRVGSVLALSPRPCRHLYTLLVVIVGWVFFRSETLSVSLAFLKAMAALGDGVDPKYSAGLFLNNEVILCLLVGTLLSIPPKTWRNAASWLFPALDGLTGDRWNLGFRSAYAAFLSLLFLLSCMSVAGGTHKAFIYSKF
ncbi:MAG: MBOAT family protein [Deltaproteobacteria bacterium]|nr:MBOAT family protein [Deltaproteobacteria bacterium]